MIDGAKSRRYGSWSHCRFKCCVGEFIPSTCVAWLLWRDDIVQGRKTNSPSKIQLLNTFTLHPYPSNVYLNGKRASYIHFLTMPRKRYLVCSLKNWKLQGYKRRYMRTWPSSAVLWGKDHTSIRSMCRVSLQPKL